MLLLGQEDIADNQNSKRNVNRIHLARRTSTVPELLLLPKYSTNALFLQCFIPAISKAVAALLLMSVRFKDWMRLHQSIFKGRKRQA